MPDTARLMSITMGVRLVSARAPVLAQAGAKPAAAAASPFMEFVAIEVVE